MLSWVHAVFLTGCGEGGVGRVGEWRSTVCDARVTHVCGLLILDREDVEVGYKPKSKKGFLYRNFFESIDAIRGRLL